MSSKKIDTLYVVIHETNAVSSTHGQFYTIVIILGFLFLALLIIINWRTVKKIFANVKPKNYKVEIPGFVIEGDIQYTSISQQTAWQIYIELITRVSGNELESDSGILREALNSLYAAFTALRQVLKSTSVEIEKDTIGSGTYTVVSLLLIIMNQQMRPFLSKWHPALQEYEQKKPADVSQYTHEMAWPGNLKFRDELKALQAGLNQYIIALKSIIADKGTR